MLTYNAQSVVDGDHHSVRVAGQHRAVEGGACVPFVRLAVDEDEHRDSCCLVGN